MAFSLLVTSSLIQPLGNQQPLDDQQLSVEGRNTYSSGVYISLQYSYGRILIVDNATV
jgi:hypothetical protein